MNKRLILLAVVLLLTGVVFWLARDPKIHRLPDGSTLELAATGVGVGNAPPVRIGFWQRFGGALPARFQNDLPNLMQPTTAGGSHKQWRDAEQETNSLQLVVHWSGNEDLDQPRLVVTIQDQDGWVWQSFREEVREIRGSGRVLVQQALFNFAAFPRWQSSLDVVVHDQKDDGDEVELGRFEVENPHPSTADEKWKPVSLPLTVQIESVTLRLEPPVPPEGLLTNTAPPAETPLTWPVTSMEQGEGGTLTNSWHVVRSVVWDNFGNNSTFGLPMRRPGDTNAPAALRWKLQLELAGDHRSPTDFNRLIPFEATAFPPPGGATTLSHPVVTHASVRVDQVQLIGPGHMEFENGQLATNNATLKGVEKLRFTSGRLAAHDGSLVRIVRIDSPVPVLAASLSGDTEDLWYSCRARDPDSGREFRLDLASPVYAEPRFSQLMNGSQLLWFSTEGLDPSIPWEFTIGLHSPKSVELILEQPAISGRP